MGFKVLLPKGRGLNTGAEEGAAPRTPYPEKTRGATSTGRLGAPGRGQYYTVRYMATHYGYDKNPL